ncbi:hypothetical protein IGI67_002027 [Enterococcus sp. AZ196]
MGESAYNHVEANLDYLRLRQMSLHLSDISKKV